MKRLLSFLIALCMILPLMIACNKETKPKEYLKIGTTDELGCVTVIVSQEGNDETADGTEALPYATVQAAMNDIAQIDHSIIGSVAVIVKSGTYSVTSPITVDPAPEQDKTAKIVILGEGDVTVTGGVTLTSSDFSPATGDAAQYFPEADKIVMIDLKNYGFTAEQINALISGGNYFKTVPALYSNGVLQTLSRYPNEGFVSVTEIYDSPETDLSKVKLPEGETTAKSIFFGEEHLDRMNTWHSTDTVFVGGHLTGLYIQDDTKIAEKSDSTPKMVLEHTVEAPKKGGVFYFYNIPEELDAPGEYYVDENAVLYYYPTEEFETAALTLPVSDGLFVLNTDARVENITLTSSRGTAVTATDAAEVWDCEINQIGGDWAIYFDGGFTDIKGNNIHNCRGGGIYVDAGDLEKLYTAAVSTVYNNHIHDYGKVIYPHAPAISANGVKVTVAHNEINDSFSKAISFTGAYQVIEYNKISNVLTASDNVGAVETTGLINIDNIVRYNHIANVGAAGYYYELPDYSYYGSAGILSNYSGSYYEVYGNVIDTINGDGIHMDGRYVNVHNNLLIGCANWYVMDTAHEYSLYFKNGETDGIYEFEDFIFSPVWKEANPDLASLIFDLNQTTKDDPRAWAVPLGNMIDRNWVYYDRYVRYFDNWGTAPYSIEDTVHRFSGDTIDVASDSRDNGNNTSYNSRRNKVVIEELLATEKVAEFVDMDWERFQTIGRVMTEWKLGE